MIREIPNFVANYYLIIPLAAVRKNNLNQHHFFYEELLGVIRKVLSGGKYIMSSIADKKLYCNKRDLSLLVPYFASFLVSSLPSRNAIS